MASRKEEASMELAEIDGPDSEAAAVDDDGRLRRTGTVWTATAHIITAVIGSGVLSLAWATAQLGWVAGPAAMVLFAAVTYYCSTLLSSAYRCSSSKRNYTYTHAVRSHLGEGKVKLCGFIQYLSLFGVCIGYTIASSLSMMAIQRANCFHRSGGGGRRRNSCRASSNRYMMMFGLAQVVLSQIPGFDQIWWLSIVAAVMSFTYSTIGLGLGIGRVAETGDIKGSLTGISVAVVGGMEKTWRSFQALGDIAFAYSFSLVLVEIQDTLASPPSESAVMDSAARIAVSLTTAFYLLCAAAGYAAFGDRSPGNLLTGFGFFDPFWLLDAANLAVVVHLLGAYQLFAQPLFSFVERSFVARPSARARLDPFRLVWRTLFVAATTALAMLMPFFNDVVGLLGAVGFWPLTVYFPVEMYIVKKRVRRWSTRWVCLQTLSFGCMVVSLVAAIGSVAGVVSDLRTYRPFKGGA